MANYALAGLECSLRLRESQGTLAIQQKMHIPVALQGILAFNAIVFAYVLSVVAEPVTKLTLLQAGTELKSNLISKEIRPLRFVAWRNDSERVGK